MYILSQSLEGEKSRGFLFLDVGPADKVKDYMITMRKCAVGKEREEFLES